MAQKLLRYQISNWSQITDCLSNNSRNLYLSLSKILDGNKLRGRLLQVNHPSYGVLFSTLIEGHGCLITEEDEEGNPINFLPTDEILKQLMKFGFYITYDVKSNLPSNMIDLLQNLYEFGYEKLNVLAVKEKTKEDATWVFRTKVVAFKTEGNLDIIDYGTKITMAKFQEKLASNLIMHLTYPDMDWSWLTYTCNIYDILEENIDPVDEYKTDTGTHGGFDYGEEGFTPYDDGNSEEEGEDDPEGVPDSEVVSEDNEDESE